MCLASHCNVGHWNGWLPAGKVIYKSRSGKYILSREWQGLALLNRENKFPEKSAKLRALCQFYPYTFACSTIYSTSTDILLVLWSEARSHGVVQYPYRSIFSAAQAESMVDVHSWINPNFANVGESTITSPLEPTLSAQPPLLSWQATLQVSSLPAYSEMCVKGLHNVSGISFGDHRSVQFSYVIWWSQCINLALAEHLTRGLYTLVHDPFLFILWVRIYLLSEFACFPIYNSTSKRTLITWCWQSCVTLGPRSKIPGLDYINLFAMIPAL